MQAPAAHLEDKGFWGGGQVLVWGWIGLAPKSHRKEFKHDFVGSLEAAVGFRLERDMTVGKPLRCRPRVWLGGTGRPGSEGGGRLAVWAGGRGGHLEAWRVCPGAGAPGMQAVLPLPAAQRLWGRICELAGGSKAQRGHLAEGHGFLVLPTLSQHAEEQPRQLHPQRQLRGPAQRPPPLALRQPDRHHLPRSLRHPAGPLHAVSPAVRGQAGLGL